MKIIIIGAGAVGSIVSNRLSHEGHDVTLIEENEQRLQQAQQSLDVLTVHGNGASSKTLIQAGIEKTGVLVSVTNTDEINILACLQAHHLGVKTKVARIRNMDYFDEKTPVFESIDAMINPDRVAVEEIHQLLFKQAATDIYNFSDGRVQVIAARVGPGAQVVGKSLIELEKEVGSRWALVAAITRRGKTIIPCGEDVLQENDHVFLVGRRGKINEALQYLCRPTPPIESVMLVGASRIGLLLAEQLGQKKINVRLIESDAERAHRAGSRLDKALVLHGSATDLDFLHSEGIDEIQGFVAVSEDEEMNLTASLLAKHHGARKTICLIKRPNYVPLANFIGIDSAVSPRLSAARAIMRYFRRGNVLSLTSLQDSDAQVLEMQATESSKIVNAPLMDIDFPRDALVAAVIKPYQVVVPRGGDTIEPGDSVIVFALPKAVRAAQKQF